jgi:hypothetical protein
MSARPMRLATLAFLALSVGPAAAFAQARGDTANRSAATKSAVPQTKQPAPVTAQTKTATPPQTKTATPPQTKTATPPQTKTPTPPQTKTATPPQTKTATPPDTKTATPPQTKAPAPQATQQKAATPPANQQQKAGAAAQNKTAPAPQPQQTKTAPQQTKTAPGQTKAPAGAAAPAQTPPRDTVVPTVMMREVYDYNRAGRRDPFISLLSTTDLRPTLSDLRLLMTVVDEPGRSVALVSNGFDKKNPQRTLRVGDRLGRMVVTSIRSDVVLFTIEEFGMNRRDSLLLRDSTKARVGR